MHKLMKMSGVLRGALAVCLFVPFMGTAAAQTTLNGLTHDSADGNHSHASAGTAEVGGFEGSEIVRGMSEFDISALTGPVASATLRFSVSALAGCCGQGPFSGTVEVVAYVGNNAANVSDFSAPATATLGTFSTAGATVGQVFNLDVTSALNAAIASSDVSFGVRLARSPESSANEALSFNNFQLVLPAAPIAAPTPVPTVSQWGLMILSALLALFAIGQMRRMRR
ncbi:MAG: IPTL-CTERM sorting domain-containing protein [Burkholderiales bacterium]|nr:IPTL-CTERM sorting domain-containing protein [Burkholderiales bacterium]